MSARSKARKRALDVLYEADVRGVNPLDVLDIVLMHRKEGAFILDTWTL